MATSPGCSRGLKLSAPGRAIEKQGSSFTYSGRGCLGEGRLGLERPSLRVHVPVVFSFIPQGKSQFKKCLEKDLQTSATFWFCLQLELFCLQVSFFAYSPFRHLETQNPASPCCKNLLTPRIPEELLSIATILHNQLRQWIPRELFSQELREFRITQHGRVCCLSTHQFHKIILGESISW